MNKVVLTGRLVSDVEIKTYGQENKPFVSNTIAVRRPRSKDETDFIAFTIWGAPAEYLSKYAKKGDFIAISGSLVVNSWNDKDGKKRISYEVRADEVEKLSSKNADGEKQTAEDAPAKAETKKKPAPAAPAAPAPASSSDDFEDLDEDELPF